MINMFIRQVILESIPRDVKRGRDALSAVSSFEEIQRHVKGARSLGEFLNNLPIGSKVWQWNEKIEMKDDVFVIKDLNVSGTPQGFMMILKKLDTGEWVSPTYVKWDSNALKYLMSFYVAPRRLDKLKAQIDARELPIVIGPADMDRGVSSYIGNIVISMAGSAPDWAQSLGPVDALILFKALDVERFIKTIENKSIIRDDSASKMFGISIPTNYLGDDGVVPVNMAALQRYDDQGAVTIEYHKGDKVIEVEVVKDPATGRPVAYPKIPL